MNKTTTILLVDKPPLFRFGLRCLLERESQVRVVAECGALESCTQLFSQWRPHLGILSAEQKEPYLLQILPIIGSVSPDTKIVVLGFGTDIRVVKALLTAGADGYIASDESLSLVCQALRDITIGRGWVSPTIARRLLMERDMLAQSLHDVQLTPREKELLTLFGQGLDHQEIARKLSLSHQTVHNYSKRLYSKIDVHSRTEAALWAASHATQLESTP